MNGLFKLIWLDFRMVSLFRLSCSRWILIKQEKVSDDGRTLSNYFSIFSVCLLLILLFIIILMLGPRLKNPTTNKIFSILFSNSFYLTLGLSYSDSDYYISWRQNIISNTKFKRMQLVCLFLLKQLVWYLLIFLILLGLLEFVIHCFCSLFKIIFKILTLDQRFLLWVSYSLRKLVIRFRVYRS
jgi:hypothetical protein